VPIILRRAVLALLILLSLSASTLVTPFAHALSPGVSYISDNGSPFGIAYDPAKGEIFVGNEDGGNVLIISDSTNAVVANISLGIPKSSVTAIAYDSIKGEIYVANTGNSSVEVISDSNNSVVASIPVVGPHVIVFDPKADEMFVGGYQDVVSVISDASDTIVATLPAGPKPENGASEGGFGYYDLAYDPATDEMFAAGHIGMAVISGVTNQLVTTINLTIGELAFDPGKNEMLANRDFNSIFAISGANNSVTETIPNVTTFWSNGIAYDTATDEILFGSSAAAIDVYSDFGKNEGGSISIGTDVGRFLYDSGTNEVFVAGVDLASTIAVISSAALSSVNSTTTPQFPVVSLAPVVFTVLAVASLLSKRAWAFKK